MGRVLRWIGIVLLALVVLVALLWTASRLRGPTAEQRAALELFQQPPATQGRNAYPLAWLLQWDVPEAELEAVTAADAARFSALPALGDPERGRATVAFTSAAAERYPDLAAALAAEPASCSLRGPGCLARVREARDAHAARLAAVETLVDRVEHIAAHDHFHNLLPATPDVPLPRLQWMALPLTRQALWFADGEHDRALAGSCRAIAGYRRLATDTDLLVFAMVGIAAIEGHANLLAEMLSELSLDHELPSECADALAPLRANELSTCAAMRGEWAWGESIQEVMAADRSTAGRLSAWLVHDPAATSALRAGYLAWPCGEEAARLRAEDAPVQPPEADTGLARFECWANLAGCVLTQIAAPAYSRYEMRAQDAAAQIRLLQRLAWMRDRAAAGDDRDARALLAAQPPQPQAGHRSFEVDADGTGLRMSLFEDSRDPHWAIPLPPALHAPAGPP